MRLFFFSAFILTTFLSATARTVADKFPTPPAQLSLHGIVQPMFVINAARARTDTGGTGRAIVDTVTIRSNAMQKDIRCVVIRPATNDSLPVLYLLHGWSGNYSNWISKVPELAEWAATYNLMIVCPDGAFSSWYFDSPVDASSKYETYIGTELPASIDSHYATRRSRNARAISGLSMGGHGALFLAFRHAGSFGAAGSMSGGLDLSVIKNRYDISKRLGDTVKLKKNYSDYSVLHVIEKKPTDSLAIIFDCGVSDGFYRMNLAVHQKMMKLGIAHDYTERPGGHDWKYWKNSLKYQLVFFHDFFTSQREK